MHLYKYLFVEVFDIYASSPLAPSGFAFTGWKRHYACFTTCPCMFSIREASGRFASGPGVARYALLFVRHPVLELRRQAFDGDTEAWRKRAANRCQVWISGKQIADSPPFTAPLAALCCFCHG